MDGYKKTALHLYGLGEADRQWLLEQLPENHQQRLTPMLVELAALGIPREPTLLSGFDGVDIDSAPSVEEEPVAIESDSVRSIVQVDPVVVGRVLIEESDAVVATVMQAYDWPWIEEVMNDFPLPRKASIVEAISRINGSIAVKVSETVLLILAERLATEAEQMASEVLSAPSPKPSARRWSFGRS